MTIPLIRPTLFIAVALRTIWSLKSFDLIYTLTAGGPSNGTAVLGYYTYLKSFVSLQLGRGAAAAYIMTFAVMIVVYFYQRSTLSGRGVLMAPTDKKTSETGARLAGANDLARRSMASCCSSSSP